MLGGPRTGKYQPALDGLRAFAVAGALAFHANILRGGFLGVDLFFVLSGYLITGLLLGEGWATWTIDLARFYTRRFRRLAPALFAVLAVCLVWAYRFAPAALAPTATKQAGWSLAYLNNWYALFGKTGYWGAGSSPLPLNHLWSLAIEEQFYLVWPILILLLVRAGFGPRQFRWVAATMAVVSGAWQWVVADRYGANRAYLGTDTRFVALAIGALLAVLVKDSAGRRARAHVAPPESFTWARDPDRSEAASDAPGPTPVGWSLAAVATTAFLTVSWFTADLARTSLYHGWLVACSAAAGVLIAAVVLNPASWFATFLSVKALVWVGKRSYSLYLWHWPIWVMITGSTFGTSGAATWAVRLTLTVAISALSYSYVEQPIRNSSLSGRQLLASIGPVAAGMAALVLVAAPVLPVSLGSQRVVLGQTGSTIPASAIPVGAPASLRILVAGDSWGRNMGYALSLADPGHRHTIIDLGVPGCGLLTPQATGCTSQIPSWEHAEAFDHPDAALLVDGTFDQLAAIQKGGPGAVCASGYLEQYAKALDTAIAALHGPANLPVYVTTTLGDAKSAACLNRALTAAAKRDGATLFDLYGLLCPAGNCVNEHAGEAVYDETQHLAAGGQKWVGGLILAAIEQRVQPVAANVQTRSPNPCLANPAASDGAGIASYTVTARPPYLDNSARDKLTDGIHGYPTFSDPAWMGWQTMNTDIVLHLAGPAAVCTVYSEWLQDLSGAVVVPPTIDVYVSNVAGQLGQQLGSAQAPQLDRTARAATISVSGSQAIIGEYVTLRVNSFGSWAMTDEVSVAQLR